MTKRIRVLDEETINKIAAGEVIENPSSVVKELVENALDAGATDIHIEIQGGGRQLIRIVDNGCGMGKDDALLCLERYATSKIREVDELTDLVTMGFRGEALPSIAAISKLTLLTAVAGSQEGTLVVAEGGRILRCCGAAREPGTTIEIKSLFFNMPVRQKFQKSPAYDTVAIQKVVYLQALSHPEVRFTLISNQQPLLVAPTITGSTAIDQLVQRISVVLGTEFVDTAVPIEVKQGPYELRGVISYPTSHRPNRTGQYVIINHRAVTSPLVSMSVRDGYGTALPTQRYPAFVLHLTLPGDLVDVNVHPQKSEVRLRNEQALRDFVRNATLAALQADSSLPVASLPPINDFVESNQALPPLPWDMPKIAEPWVPAADPVIPEFPDAQRQPIPWTIAAAPPEAPLTMRLPQVTMVPRVLQTLPGYILLDPQSTHHLEPGQNGLWVVDQRAAHQRILFDRLNAKGHSNTIDVEGLLIPLTIPLNRVDHDLTMEAIPELERLGFHVEAFGASSLCVRAIPCEFNGLDIADLIVLLVHELRDSSSRSVLDAERHKRLSLKASQAAVSRQRQLPLLAAEQLVKDLFQCDSPYRCPQGHPTLICLDADRLAKLFQR